ncbi:MAG TPA: Hsp20/alpha crystallin family protein [Bacteroidia bacterium]|nr:Hsp20/alpha crystallin family protein [Bacteroidia bacterium]
MSLIVRNRSLLPTVSNFFDTGKFFSPGIFDFDGDLTDSDGSLVVPEANIIENEKDFRIEIAAPGLEKKDFNVAVQNGMLTVSAEKEEEKKENRKNFMRREFSYNSFSRAFTLPENSLADKIDAKYENGVLRLTLPKKEVTVSKPKKEIKVS